MNNVLNALTGFVITTCAIISSIGGYEILTGTTTTELGIAVGGSLALMAKLLPELRRPSDEDPAS